MGGKMPKSNLLIVDSTRTELLDTYRNLKLICDNQGCESYRLHILDQYQISDIDSLSDEELAVLNNMTSGCILKWLTD